MLVVEQTVRFTVCAGLVSIFVFTIESWLTGAVMVRINVMNGGRIPNAGVIATINDFRSVEWG